MNLTEPLVKRVADAIEQAGLDGTFDVKALARAAIAAMPEGDLHAEIETLRKRVAELTYALETIGGWKEIEIGYELPR